MGVSDVFGYISCGVDYKCNHDEEQAVGYYQWCMFGIWFYRSSPSIRVNNKINNNKKKEVTQMSTPAEQIKEIFSGLAGLANGLSSVFEENDVMEKILFAWLLSKGMNTNGYSLKHFNRDGNMEFKLKAYSVANGQSEDMLYHASRADLKRWAEKHMAGVVPSTQPVRPIIQIQK